MRSSVQPTGWFLWGSWTAVVLFVLGACSPEHYKAEADKEVYSIIDGKWQDSFGEKANYAISDVPPSPDDIQVERGVPPSGVITLSQAVAMATAHNRGYQRQKEQLYLTALDLTLARHQFARQWFATVDASYVRNSEDELVGYDAGAGFNQLLADGAIISANVALDWVRFLTDDPRTTIRSVLSANVTQPLLRGSGREVVQENLTQAERNALYQIRSFSRFRKDFVVSMVNSYYRVLQRRDEVTNAENDYESRVASRERVEMEAEAGRKPPFEVDQARQSELAAVDNLLRTQQRYEQELDEFKIMLSLPTDAEVVLDQNELEVLKKTGVAELDYAVDAAIETAFSQRLDLANSRDAVDDAARKVMVAADNLGVELNLIGSANVTSADRSQYRRLEFDKGTYTLGLEADLALDRKAERNAYREALIAVGQRQREYEDYVDQVKLDVRAAYRTLREEAESYRTQQVSLELAKERVESTSMLLQAGRATTRDWLESQDALLRAQNSLTGALISHAVAKLVFFRDIGILQVRPDGMCEQWRPQQADAGDSSAEPEESPENSTIRDDIDTDGRSDRLDRPSEPSAAVSQVDFRDFLARPVRIWEQ